MFGIFSRSFHSADTRLSSMFSDVTNIRFLRVFIDVKFNQMFGLFIRRFGWFHVARSEIYCLKKLMVKKL